MNSKFDFILAPRFIALVIGALSIYAKAKGLIGEPEMVLISTIMGGFIGVRTLDRMSEQKVLAAAVTSGEVSAETATGIPPEK